MSWNQKRKDKQKLFKLNEKALKDAGLISGKAFIKIKNRTGNVIFSKRRVDRRSTEYKNIINRYANELIPYVSTTTSWEPGLFDDFQSIIDLLMRYRGQTFNFRWEDREAIISVPRTGSFTEILKFFQADSENSIFDDYAVKNQVDSVPSATISVVIDAERNQLAQSFLDSGINHCVFNPIREHYKKMADKFDKDTSKYMKYKVNSIIKNCDMLEKEYSEGVPEDKLQDVVDKLGIGGIDVCFPFQKTDLYLSVRHSTKQEKIFRFINTRKNHLELSQLKSNVNDISGIVSNDNVVEVEDLDELYKIKMELDEKNDFYLYEKSTKNISTIYTLQTKYTLPNPYRDVVSEFEKAYNIKSFKICDIHDKELSEFVRQAVHYNRVINFKPKEWNTELIDQEKCYYNYHKNEYVVGVLGKITDYREVSEMIRDDKNEFYIPALYKVRNFNFSNVDPHKRKILEKLNSYHDYNVYPSCELHFLLDIGVSFDVIEGCWGTQENLYNDIVFPEEFKQKDKYNVSYYAKYVGSCNSQHLTNRVFLKGSKEYLQNIQCYVDAKIQYEKYGTEGFIEYKKEYNRHFSHFTAFVTASARITAIQQLFLFNYDNILRVVSDGIYYVGEKPKLVGTYRTQPVSSRKWGDGNDTYCSGIEMVNYENVSDELVHWLPKFRKNYSEELHIGPGGTGKTHCNLLDKGFIRPVYIAPSWKLCAAKKEEYGIPAFPKAHLIDGGGVDTKHSVKITNNYNVWIIDEVSQMSEEELKILRKVGYGSKLINIGDIGYQLPCVSGTPATVESFGNIHTVKYTKTFRFQCPRLEHLLNNIRQKIDNQWGGWEILNYIIRECKDRVIESEEDIYNINDYILTYTNKTKDKYTDKYKGTFGDLEKVMFTERYKEYFNGTIKIFNKDELKELSRFKAQHGFTTHCIQGETIPVENKIFIDIERFQADPRLIYTAMSRARKLEQIYFIKKGKK